MANDKQTPKAQAKVFTEEEVGKHNSETDCWLIIGGEVYDVTKYLDDHPGGSEVLMEFAGSDGTTMFEDVGHSSEARTTMKQYVVGSLKGGEGAKKVAAAPVAKKSGDKAASGGLSPLAIIFLLLAVVLGVYFTQAQK